MGAQEQADIIYRLRQDVCYVQRESNTSYSTMASKCPLQRKVPTRLLRFDVHDEQKNAKKISVRRVKHDTCAQVIAKKIINHKGI